LGGVGETDGCLSCERNLSGPWTSYVNRMKSVWISEMRYDGGKREEMTTAITRMTRREEKSEGRRNRNESRAAQNNAKNQKKMLSHPQASE
jgi:hypothetical protein